MSVRGDDGVDGVPPPEPEEVADRSQRNFL